MPVRKGEQTQALILNEALSFASLVGLEGLSIGALAERLGLSKSGLFAHFGSKEDLQLQTLRQAQALFHERVFRPALEQDPGLPRLTALFSRWIQWLDGTPETPGGCLLLTASVEYDDRPGLVRDLLVSGQRELRGAIAKLIRGAIEEGQLPSDTDPWQLTFEIFGAVLAAHHDHRLLRDSRAFERARAAFHRLIAACQDPL
ncbi:MAG: TetR/AcrR family transcriptional regulator [Burkholderiales bacterium]